MPDEVERGRREARVFHQITGETDKLRRKRVDRAHDFGRVVGIALVMQIAELHEAAARLGLKIEVGDSQPGRFSKATVDPRGRRQGDEAEAKKLSPAKFLPLQLFNASRCRFVSLGKV